MKVSKDCVYPVNRTCGDIFYSESENYIFNKEIKTGPCVCKGTTGTVYIDAENTGYIIKEIKVFYGYPEDEVNLFNQYYGEKSAAVVGESGGVIYIRMKKIPGIPLNKINENIFFPDAVEKFHNMLCLLGDKKIMHFDLNLGNILYDHIANKFHPIDFDNIYKVYFSVDQNSKDYYNVTSDALYQIAVEHITKHTIEPIPLKQGCIIV